MLALVISMISYALFVLVAGATAVRDASGVTNELVNDVFLNCTGRDCHWGLMNSYSVSHYYIFIVAYTVSLVNLFQSQTSYP